MLWKLTQNSAEPVTTRITQSTAVGSMLVYQINGEFFVETSDMASMGLWRGKFLEEELPKIRKSLNIETIPDKFKDKRPYLRKASTQDEEEPPKKDAKQPYPKKTPDPSKGAKQPKVTDQK